MSMFVRVVETGSFSAVARELNSTQPTVSKNVAELESWLGAKLLNRTTRSLRLTETGADYYERCVGILQDVEEAESTVGQLQTQPKGTVRISASVAFARLHIVPRLAPFFSRYPDIKVDLRLNDREVDLVEEGVDLAFRMGQLSDSSLIAKTLCRSPMITVASPTHLELRGTPDHPRDLKEHNCIVYTGFARGNELTFNDEGDAIFIRVDGCLITNNGDALRTALISDLGIGMVPLWLVGDAIQNGELVQILGSYQPEETEIHAVYPPGRHLPSKVRCFLDYFTEQFRNCETINSGNSQTNEIINSGNS